MDKVALTSKGPYVGVSTFARDFLKVLYGYEYVSMSDVLIEAWVNSVYGSPAFMKKGLSIIDKGSLIAYVKNNKSYYRAQLQLFGQSSGFGTDPSWMGICLRSVIHSDKVVIEKVRTDVQAWELKSYGYKVVELRVPYAVRLRNAKACGVDDYGLACAMAHPVEQGISADLIDLVLEQEDSTDFYDLAAIVAEQA